MTTVTRTMHVPAHRHVGTVAGGLVLLAGLAVGVLSWLHQLDEGLSATGLGGVVPWGLYTVMLVLFVTGAAGALAVASVGVLVGAAGLASAVRPALAVSVAASAGAVLAVAVDLGRPERIANLLLHPNWQAPLVWACLGVLVTLVVGGAMLLVRRAGVVRRVLAAVGLTAALALPVLTAWVFVQGVSRPGWNDPLAAPTLLTASAVVGVSLVLVTGSALRAAGREGVDAVARGRLAAVLLVAVVAFLSLALFGYVSALGGGPQERAAVDLLLPGGSWSWVFWTQWVVGGALPVLLLALPRLRRRPWASSVAAGLATVGAAASYVVLVAVGLAAPPVALPPGVPTGSHGFEQTGSYLPTWTEYGVAVGLLAVAVGLVVAMLATHRRDRP